ncbi:MAG: NYN domain-containing protein [Thermodesulfobacteriota bacterium]|nr:MAG: NYN domain-containing protein [Thermodesulfobacteriota bacterium]
MALNLIIDGYNLIGSRRGGLGDIEEERRCLLETLVIYKRLKKARITVVFDGPAMTYPGSHPAGLEVVFSAGRQADAVIRDMVARKGSGATVITSDREIAGFAKARGAVVLGSDEFSAFLDDALYEDMKGVAAEEEDASGPARKGPSRRLPKDERKKQGRIRKLRGK